MSSDQTDPPMTVNQLEHDSDDFITPQQPIDNTNNLTTYQLTHSPHYQNPHFNQQMQNLQKSKEFLNADTLMPHPNSTPTPYSENYCPQDTSPIYIFSFVNLKNDFLVFLGWPHYMLEKLTILYAMFNFFGFLFSLLRGIYNTCALHAQVSKQASVASVLFAGFLGIFYYLNNPILQDAQIQIHMDAQI